MGGDNAPDIVVNGASQSKIRHPNLKFTFVGDKNRISPLISEFPNLHNSDIVHTNEIVSADAKPSIALRSGKKFFNGTCNQPG